MKDELDGLSKHEMISCSVVSLFVKVLQLRIYKGKKFERLMKRYCPEKFLPGK